MFLPAAVGLARLQHCSASNSGNCSGQGGDGSGEAWPGCLVGTETSAISPAWILQRGGSITSAIIGTKIL